MIVSKQQNRMKGFVCQILRVRAANLSKSIFVANKVMIDDM